VGSTSKKLSLDIQKSSFAPATTSSFEALEPWALSPYFFSSLGKFEKTSPFWGWFSHF
jgi:hypothetical protein